MSETLESFSLSSADGTSLHAERLAAQGTPKTRLAIVPGFGEHIGRYHHLMDWLSQRGVSSAGVDPRGHGRSAGRRSYISRWSEYVDDTHALLDHLRAEKSDVPLVLLGHSQGGLIALHAALRSTQGLSALVLSAPAMRFCVKISAAKAAAGRMMSRLWPTMTLPAGLPASDLCRDAAIVRAYETDPLVNKIATSRWYTEALQAQDEAFARAPSLQLRTLVLSPRTDKVIDPISLDELFTALGCPDKHKIDYEGYYHEVLNEPERESVYQDIYAWIGK